MVQKFIAKLQKAEDVFFKFYQGYCNSYILLLRFMVDGNNSNIVHLILEGFPKQKNDILKDSAFFREVFGRLPNDLIDIEEVILYCFNNFQNKGTYIITPIIPYTIYSHFLHNGGITAENFNSIIEDCVFNNDFSIMNDGFGLRIAFYGKNERFSQSYENPAV